MTKNPVQMFYANLLETQVAPRDRIVTRQRHLLEKLLRHARAHSPFYRDTRRLDCVFAKDGSIEWEMWDAIPILSRSEAHDHCKELTAEWLPPEMSPVEDDCTSGSTGEPLPFQRTALSHIVSAALVARAIHWHETAPVGRFAVFQSQRRAAEASATNKSSLTGPAMVPLDAAPSDQAGIIHALRPTHIKGRANILAAIIEASDRPFKGVKLAFQSGEVLHPTTRAIIEQGFGAPVADVYATAEVGPIAMEGPEGGFRICEENAFLESSGAIVGQAAPVVVTPFYNYATPLIRYAPNDYVRFSEKLDRRAPGLRRLDAVIGRERNLFRRPDGVRFSPELSGWTMNGLAPSRQWRLTQTSLHEAIFEVVFDDVLKTPRDLSSLQRYLTEAVAPLDVRIQLVASIVDDRRNGKAFECYRSLVS